ncbi:MAG: serine/threonine-protein kinase [Phycisphaerae bacterium]
MRTVLPDDAPPMAGSSAILDLSLAGRKLGRYRILSLLGKGGMGVVWRGHDDVLCRDVAIKILASRKSRRRRHDRPGLNVDLFMQEARAVAKLQHPSVVSIFEVVEDQGERFLVLELMEGGTLKELVERDGPVAPRDLFAMMVGSAKALEAAHKRGVIHRDIKPSNFMFDDHGHLKLGDFGLADVADEDVSDRLRGRAVGSLGWVAPEAARGEPIRPVSDVYCMGLVMLYALRGRPWLRADSRTRLLALHQNPPAVDLSDIETLTPAGADLLRRCLAVSPEERFESAGALAEALDACARPSAEPVMAHRAGAGLTVAMTVFAVLAGVGWGLYYLNAYFERRAEQFRQPLHLRVPATPDRLPPAARETGGRFSLDPVPTPSTPEEPASPDAEPPK